MIDLNSVFGGGKASLSALKLYGFIKNGGGWRYAKKNYGAPPEYLWKKTPDCAALRAKNGKWFAVILTVEPSKLGLDGDKKLEIIDLLVPKGEPARIADGKNYFLGYHMNKQSWLTVPLDGRVNAEIICGFLDISYSLAMKR